MPDAEMRRRVERLLSGSRDPSNLLHLILFARDNHCDGRQSVREIGDFVAHRQQRTKGFVTDKARDLSCMINFWCKYDANSGFDIASIDADFKRFLEASLHAHAQTKIKRNRITRQARKSAVATIINNIRTLPDGRLSLVGEDGRPLIGKADFDVIKFFMENLSIKKLFSGDSFFLEFASVLKDNDLLSKQELTILRNVSPSIQLFALSMMHGTKISLENGKVAELLISSMHSEDNTLGVNVRFNVSSDEEGFIMTAIVETNLLREKYCEPSLLSQGASLDVLVELKSNGLLGLL